MLNPNLQSDYNPGKFINPAAFVQQSLTLPVCLDLEKEIPEDDISRTVLRCVEESGLIRYVKTGNRDCDDYRAIDMLKAVCLSYTLHGFVSLREMDSNARNDLRFRLIFNTSENTPSFMAFKRFIDNDLGISLEELFAELNKYMASQLPEEIDPDTIQVDGTKEEADANKMTFVWRKASEKFYARCYKRAFDTLSELIKYFNENHVLHRLSILRKLDLPYMIEVTGFLEKYARDNGIVFVHGKGKRKKQFQRWYETIRDCAKQLFKYELHFDILEDRNSFSKTDPDATFMHMKYDYYNHTNVFKPGYNVQMGNTNGIIWDIYISEDCSDMKTFIPLMELHMRLYGKCPNIVPADAGYGCYDNYKFCKDHAMGLYMKYPGYEARKEKLTDKNRFKSCMFQKDENGMPVCPAGYAFRVEKTRIETRGVYPREMQTLVNDHCADCPFKSKCTKSKKGVRTIQRCVQLEEWQEEVDRNLETDLGKKLMRNRQIFSEGIFGDKKYNWRNAKLRRVGESGVKKEIYLYAIGHNMRRFHKLWWEKKKKEQEELEKVNKLIDFARSVSPNMPA